MKLVLNESLEERMERVEQYYKLNEDIEEEFTYKFLSPVMITADEIEDMPSNSWFEPLNDNPFAYTREINNILKDEDITEYLPEYVTSCAFKMVSYKGKAYLLTTVTTDKKLNPNELKHLMNDLAGQFSDGWGESFEQHPFYTYEYTTVYDDDDEEEYGYQEEKNEGHLYFHTWFSGQVNKGNEWENIWNIKELSTGTVVENLKLNESITYTKDERYPDHFIRFGGFYYMHLNDGSEIFASIDKQDDDYYYCSVYFEQDKDKKEIYKNPSEGKPMAFRKEENELSEATITECSKLVEGSEVEPLTEAILTKDTLNALVKDDDLDNVVLPLSAEETVQELLQARENTLSQEHQNEEEISNATEPEEMVNRGLADMINNLLKSEFDAVTDYNNAISTIVGENAMLELIPIFEDIRDEENVHIGQLQKALQQVSEAANNIDKGVKEAEGQLEEPTTDEE